MGIFFRNSKKIGPFRVNTSTGGVGGSIKIGPARITRRANGSHTISFRNGSGLSYTKSLGGLFGKKKR
ncbi:DUF4236 domain-containing protein [Corynebacterium auriscanis]|uniref:DUF4236 domain-containing protein n=1 Tax=Corynebacterium auriscanis TaxID=99807 RepID=A0A0A2DI44_9CORY|nr:DUF4236 domain-containing protein [Corynebacterium auriscanis]KGM18865.1 hypothetical protein MA47_04410 [Corynebacterium auriscanis]WJY73574.1 hypothetical protein CAURIC_09855 [Corynebacterium auriscanis]